MTTGRTLLKNATWPSSSLLSGRTHDPRWLRLHPQLLGADATGGWTELIEHVDVALADAPRAADLAPTVEARVGLVTDRELWPQAQAAQDGVRDRERELVVVMDRERVALAEAVAGELLAHELGTVEEPLHPQGEQLVLVAQIVGGRGEQILQAQLEGAAVLHDLGLSALVDDLLLQLPLLFVAHPDGGAEVVEEEDQAGLVLADELGGGRGQVCLALRAGRGELRAKHAEEAVADVANDLVLRHEDVPLPCQEKVLPKDDADSRGRDHFEETGGEVKGDRSRTAAPL